MATHNLNSITEDLYMLLLLFHKNILTHEELTKQSTIPPSQAKLLLYLKHKGPISISEIGNILSISKPNMTPLIDNLVSQNLIIRVNDLNDRRKINLEITKEGFDFLKKQEAKLKEILNQKLSPLDDNDLNTLKGSIDDMFNVLNKIKNC